MAVPGFTSGHRLKPGLCYEALASYTSDLHQCIKRALECPCHISICTDESLKLIEMRLLTLLATAVLLAACVHDTDDFELFLAESGVSLTYYIGSDGSTSQKEHDDPWDTINENFGFETIYTGKKKHGTNDEPDDPWDTINEVFPIESVHTGKRKGQSFRGKPVVEMLFVSVGGEKGGEEDPWNLIHDLFPDNKSGGVLLKLVEVRGQVGRFDIVSTYDGELLDGPSVFALGVPSDWETGLVLRAEAYLLDTKKMLPLMGAVVWEVDRILSELPKAR